MGSRLFVVAALLVPVAIACSASSEEDAATGDDQNIRGQAGASGASCTLTCEGELLECSEGGTPATCKPDRFRALPRCLYQVTFQSRSCNATKPSGGSCSLVCGGQLADCQSAPSESACNAQLFAALPRCP